MLDGCLILSHELEATLTSMKFSNAALIAASVIYSSHFFFLECIFGRIIQLDTHFHNLYVGHFFVLPFRTHPQHTYTFPIPLNAATIREGDWLNASHEYIFVK